MKILITGISGLLGPYIAEELINSKFCKNEEITGIYNSFEPKYNKIKSIKVNLSSIEEIQLKLNLKYDFIIHLAAATDHILAEKDKDYAYKGNVLSTKNLLEIAKKTNSKFIYVSTEAVFFEKTKTSEDEIPNPKLIYGITKVEAENLVKNYQNHLILRTTIFGKSLNGREKLFEHVVFNLNNNIPIKAIEDNLFTPITTQYFSKITLELIKKDAIGIFNISSDEKISRYELSVLLAKKFNLNTNLIQKIKIKDLVGNIPRSKYACLDNTKIKNYLNLKEVSIINQIEKLSI